MTHETGQLLDQLCATALKLLAGTPNPPQRLSMRAGDVSVDLELAEGTVQVPATPTAQQATDDCLTAPTVGVFYRAPEPGADPFVREGDMITPGQQVGIIEAMKLMIPVETDRAGQIRQTLKEDAEPVEYGEPLFAIEAA